MWLHVAAGQKRPMSCPALRRLKNSFLSFTLDVASATTFFIERMLTPSMFSMVFFFLLIFGALGVEEN